MSHSVIIVTLAEHPVSEFKVPSAQSSSYVGALVRAFAAAEESFFSDPVPIDDLADAAPAVAAQLAPLGLKLEVDAVLGPNWMDGLAQAVEECILRFITPIVEALSTIEWLAPGHPTYDFCVLLDEDEPVPTRLEAAKSLVFVHGLLGPITPYQDLPPEELATQVLIVARRLSKDDSINSLVAALKSRSRRALSAAGWPTSQRGRPPGTGQFSSAEEFLLALGRIIVAAQEQDIRPTQENIAELLDGNGVTADPDGRSLRRHVAQWGLGNWEEVRGAAVRTFLARELSS